MDWLILRDKIQHRKVQEYKMQLMIAHNPHRKDYKTLFNILDEQDPKTERVNTAEFDAKGFEMLKQKLHQSPRFEVK